MKTILFRLWQWTWGLPQSLVGLIVFCVCRNKPHSHYHGAIVTHWGLGGSMGMGMFLFLGTSARQEEVLVHEYGHAVQSLFLGPLFLPIMGIPSFLWCNLPVFQKLRQDKHISYYTFYPESTANALGRWATGEKCDL